LRQSASYTPLMRPQVLLFLFITFLFFSCNSRTNNSIDTISTRQKITKKLSSNSDYHISVWNDYSIQERNGPDFTVYYLYPTDTTKKLFGNGGIYFGGHPKRIRPDGDKKLIKDSLINGNLLGKPITWTIFDYGNSISAETILELGDYEKISAFAYGQSYSDIDSLIRTLESLNSNK
jgi:hypothetical protein